MKNPCAACAQKGLTLIELMIAMLLGVFLIGGVLQIFLSTKQTNRMQDSLARLQENGRFAMDFIGRDMRLAGYRSCLNYTVPTPITGTNDNGLNFSDTIIVQYSTDACPGTTTTITYFIQNGASGRPSLFKNDGVSTTELIEDIENMQVLYGDDANGDSAPDYYVPAGTAGLNMARVVSIRVSFLLSSEDNLADKPLSYSYNGITDTQADLKIRRVFTSTIALRNLLP